MLADTIAALAEAGMGMKSWRGRGEKGGRRINNGGEHGGRGGGGTGENDHRKLPAGGGWGRSRREMDECARIIPRGAVFFEMQKVKMHAALFSAYERI